MVKAPEISRILQQPLIGIAEKKGLAGEKKK
jgi:hypothetical protein